MLEEITHERLAGIDWENDRAELGRLISRLMPIESLLPDLYEDWRPVVRDAVAYVGSHLSKDRLLPKLIEQARLPGDLSLEKRLLILIQRMPSLQKIGQTVARNRNLDPAFRKELSKLENAIQEVSVDEMRAVIEQELGDRWAAHEVAIDDEILAEASVSAVLGFSWLDPRTGHHAQGVFKVLKPHVRAHFAEELEILSGLAEYFDSRGGVYGLSEVRLSEVFENVRRLLEEEVRFVHEQANLKSAARRFSGVAGVRVPQLIEALSTPVLTAMSAERGQKVTEAFPEARQHYQRRKVAGRLIEALVAIPLLSPEPEAVFHADPHAGNLFVDPRNQDLLLYDWALTGRLSRPERRAILLLVTAVTLRDRYMIASAVSKLCETEVIRDSDKAEVVRKQVRRFLDDLSPLMIAGVKDALTLVDRLMRAGIAFSGPLVIFRKMLFTLDGVLNDVMPGMRMDPTLAWYITRERAKTSPGLQRLTRAESVDFPLSGLDQLVAAWSAQFYWLRTGMQTGRQIRRFGWSKLRKFLAG